MTNLLRFDFNDRDGIFEVIEDGYWVRATDYDALAAKLAEVEEMKRLLAMDKINLRGELAGVQGKLAAANDQLDSARHSVTVLEGRADHFKARAEAAEAERDKFHQLWKHACIRSGENSLRAEAAEQLVATLEAALPAVYRLALEDAVNTLRTKRTHMHTTRHEMAQDIRALPTPTADELMARIQTGEKDE